MKSKKRKLKNWKVKNKKQKNKNGQWPLCASARYRHGRWIECFWETNERERILDKLDCDDQLLSDISDISSEIDDVDKREHDSMILMSFLKILSVVMFLVTGMIQFQSKWTKFSWPGMKGEKLAAFHWYFVRYKFWCGFLCIKTCISTMYLNLIPD